ncbi:4Fe-4S binding protein [Maridesulfovibrio sp. FT414]|uniref:4Fe-4S binding protein n=1 Tax=Maridesulfovibrio sp. FT414 TaxID=2979469 RepID=UPI003D8055AA
MGLSLYLSIGWWGFLLIFPYVGGCVSLGVSVSRRFEGKRKDLGRRLAILAVSPVFLIFLGLMQRENLQLEETVFYYAFFLSTGVFTRVLIHYAVAKVVGPLIWGRGFCGWACWTAALLEWLPVHENRPVSYRWTHMRWPALFLSLAIPILCLASGYDYRSLHIDPEHGKSGQLLWFMVGNGVYYACAVSLAFIFRKKRAFCRILCLMKPGTSLARIRKKPTGRECVGCGQCNENCPMDVDVMAAVMRGEPVSSTECILCGQCASVCPVGAVD